MLQKYDRVVVADGGLEQTLGVLRRGGADELQTRNMGEEGLHVLRVLRRAAAAGAHRGAENHGNLDLSAGHVVQLRRLIHHGVKADGDKVVIHQLDDGALAAHGGAHADAREAPLADGRGENAVGAVLLQQADARAEGAAQRADVLAQNDDVLIAEHFFINRLADGGDHRGLAAHRATLLSLSQA